MFNYAIRANKKKLLKKIVPSQYINTENHRGYTPLMIASVKGYIQIVELLLNQKNCKPLKTNKYHRIALHYAAERGYFKCVEKLCKYKNGLNHQDLLGNTPHHAASINKQTHIIDYLVKKGADTMIENTNGVVPFFIIYQENIQDTIEKTTLNHMLQAKDKNNNSLFHLFTKTKNVYNYDYDNYLQFLLKKGLNIYDKNNDQLTPLNIIDNEPELTLLPSRKALSFYRIASDNRQYVLFAETLKILPKELRILILIMYYKLNTKTIFAKIEKLVPAFFNPYVEKNTEKNTYNFTQLSDDVRYFPLLYRPTLSFLE